MFEKLLEIILGAKSGALGGLLILAGAVVTVTSGNGVTTVTIEHPSPPPMVETSAKLTPSPLESAGPSTPPKRDEGEKRDEGDKRPATAPAPASCEAEIRARNDARQKVQASFAKYHAALEQLRGEHPAARAAETLKKADAMLREIAEKAQRILGEMGACPDPQRENVRKNPKDDDDEDEDEGEPQTRARVTVVASTRVDADPLTMQQVAERAVAAMETVFNLAKSAATATPPPTPTEKPRGTGRHRSSKR